MSGSTAGAPRAACFDAPIHPNRKELPVPTPSVRVGLSALALGTLALGAVACSKPAEPVNVGAPPSSISITTPSISVPDVSELTQGSSKPKEVTVPQQHTTTTAKPANGGDFGGQAYEAVKGKLGDFKALQFTIFFGDQQRAEVQAQDPAKPANVDEYTVKDGSVSKPVPVKLTGDGSLEENVFDPSTIAWDKLQSMMNQAKQSIPIDDSKGITHIIIEKNLPFDSDTVVNIYVDGGARSDGGYVSFLADGTLKKVYGPSNT
jgi:hypothetical protein